MPRLTFAVPGDIEARTGGTVYNRKVMEALREQGWWVDLLSWPGSFPFPSEACRDEVEDSLAALPDNALVAQRTPLADIPARMAGILADPATLCHLIRYQER